MQSISLGGPDAPTRGVNPGIYLGQLVRSGPQPLRFTEPPLRGFVIHLCIYVIVIAGLASLNLTRNPSRPCRWLGHHSCGSRCRPAHEVSTRTGGPLLGQASVRNFGAKPSNTSKTPPNAAATVILIAGWTIEREHEIKRRPDDIQTGSSTIGAAAQRLASP